MLQLAKMDSTTRSVHVKALEAKPPGTPYLDANSMGSSVASRPGEAMRVASFVAEMSKRATSNAPVFDSGTGSEGAWAPPQKEGVPSLRMPPTSHSLAPSKSLPNSQGQQAIDSSRAFSYERAKIAGTHGAAFLAPIQDLVDRNRTGANKADVHKKAGNVAATFRHRTKSMVGGAGGIPNLQQVLDENSQFLIAQLTELGVTDGEAVRDMLMMDERKGMITPMWALDHIHCAIEIFAHGFQNLVEELIKLALAHSKEKKEAEILELNNEGHPGDEFSYDMDMSGPQGVDEAEVEEYGASLLLKSWALLLRYAEDLTLQSEQKLLEDRHDKKLEDLDIDESEAKKKSHSLASKTGPLARVALQLDRQNKKMSEALSKSNKKFQMSEASRMPLVEALKEAKARIEYIGKENDTLEAESRRVREERIKALEMADEAHLTSLGLKKEITKLAKLPVKVSELTRRVAANDSVTRSSTVSLENLTRHYDLLKAQHHKLKSEYTEIEEALLRSRGAQASAEKKLNHALDAKALAVEERIRAEQRAHLASTARNTAENLYTMAENSLSTVREKLISLEQSDKEKSIQLRALEEQVSHTSAMAREYEVSYKAYKEELEVCKAERDNMKRELSFLNRSSTERNVELAKIERGYKTQIVQAEAEAKTQAERCEKALQEEALAKKNLDAMKKEVEKKEAYFNRNQVKLSRELKEAQESLKLYQKNSKDLLAERIAKWKVKEKEYIEDLEKLQNTLMDTKGREMQLRGKLSDTEERLKITEEEYSNQIEHEMSQRNKAEQELADLGMRFQDQINRTAELAKEFKAFREKYDETSRMLEQTVKEKQDLQEANQNLHDMNTNLEYDLTVETEAHLESRDQLEVEVTEVRDHLEVANKLMADAETALLQLSLGLDLQSICPAGVTPVAYSQKMVEELRTPVSTPPSRHGSIEEVRASAASRVGTPRPTTRGESPQIMFINQDQSDSHVSLPPIHQGRLSAEPHASVPSLHRPLRIGASLEHHG